MKTTLTSYVSRWVKSSRKPPFDGDYAVLMQLQDGLKLRQATFVTGQGWDSRVRYWLAGVPPAPEYSKPKFEPYPHVNL